MTSYFALAAGTSIAFVSVPASATAPQAKEASAMLAAIPFATAAAAAAAQDAPSTPLDAPPTTALLRWFNSGDLGRTQWSFDDVNAVGWAQAARAAAELCDIQGIGAGHFNGHQDLSKRMFGVQCSDAEVVWRDASAQEVSASGWGFSDINQVSWAQANRAAERLCASANQGYAGGHFNGHQGNGNFGLFCYRGEAKWFDASDAELAATGWGFATPKLDDVQWSQAMRAATGFCQGKGFDGGFMNGHQAPNKYGVVCQKPIAITQVTTPTEEVVLPEAGPSRSGPAQIVVRPLSASEQQGILKVHNRERSAEGLSPVAWEPDLAQESANWAYGLALSGGEGISDAASLGRGENVVSVTAGEGLTAQTMAESWALQRSNFRPGVYPMVNDPKAGTSVSAYTQIIWPTTTHVGCGYQRAETANWLVCRYSPAGNVDGVELK